MRKQTYLITGGNSGLGFETARRIAAKGGDFSVILACRNPEKGNAAAESLIGATDNPNVRAMRLDLCSFQSVREFAGEIARNGVVIDGLDNNAGIAGIRSGLTKDGVEIVFQSNHLGHFLLTNLLLPYMAENARILNVTSDMHNPPYGELVWNGAEALAHPDADFAADRARYFYSKLCNLYFTYELSRRLHAKGSRITVSALNPGFMGDTNLAQGHMSKERIEEVKRTMPERYGELSVSAQAAADIMTEPNYAVAEARYYSRGVTPTRSSELSYSETNARELWEVSEKLTGWKEEPV